MTRSAATSSPRALPARMLNLAAAGAGQIAIGEVAIGAATAIAFALAANAWLWMTLIVPLDYSPFARGLTLVVAMLIWGLSQWRLGQRLREIERARRLRHRRAALAESRRLAAAGDLDGAYAALAPVIADAEHDLTIATRVAQLVTGMGDAQETRAAWARVSRLDRRHLYRREIRRHLGRESA